MHFLGFYLASGTIISREEAIELYGNLEIYGGGGEATVFDSGESVVRIEKGFRTIFRDPQDYLYNNNVVKIINLQRNFTDLPIPKFHNISLIKSNGLYYPNGIINKDKHSVSETEETWYYPCSKMEKVLRFEDLKSSPDNYINSFALAKLYLASKGISEIEDKHRNRGYKIVDQAPEYKIMGHKYKAKSTENNFQAIFFDVTGWKIEQKVDEDHIKKMLSQLIQNDQIEVINDNDFYILENNVFTGRHPDF